MSIGKSQAQINADLRAGASNYRLAVCVAVDWENYLATVNINGGEVTIPMVGSAPFPGDNVWVGWLGQKPICMGRVPKASTATVISDVVDGKVTVLADDSRTYTVVISTTAEILPTARVVLDWDANGALVGVLAAEPATGDPILPPSSGGGGAPGGSTVNKMTFNPSASGTWNGSSYYTNDVGCSASEQGLYIYGNTIGDTIPDGATVTVAKIYLAEFFNRFPGSLAKLGTHTRTSRSGAPNVVGALEIPDGAGWKNILPFADDLKTGAAKGIGTNHGGWHKYSPAKQKNSGAIYMEWS